MPWPRLLGAGAALALAGTVAFASEPNAAPDAPFAQPLTRPALTLAIGGAQDGWSGVEPLRSGWISARASTLIAGNAETTAEGVRAWGMTGTADARLFGMNLPAVDGARRFFRFGLSLGGFYMLPDRTVYSVDAGAFVAEQGALLGSPSLRPRVVALGTVPSSATLTFIYGAGYTYNFGTGLPLPFFGVRWRFDPAWELDALLPVNVRITYRATPTLAIGGATGIAGDVFDYRPVTAVTPEPTALLKVTRFRLGAFGRHALSPSSFVRLDLGVEATRIDAAGAIDHARGGYLEFTFGVGSAGPAAYGPVRSLNGF